LLARRLPKSLQSRALTYGLVGAFAFRLLAIAVASYLLHWRIAKLLGGGYLVYVAVKHFLFESGVKQADLKHEESILAGTAPASSVPHRIDYAHAATTHERAFWL